MNRTAMSHSPVRVVIILVAALYLLTALVFLIGRRISVRSEDRLFTRADFPVEDLVFDRTEIPALRGKKSTGVDLQKVIQPSTSAVARGAALYSENCSVCHGERGSGDGPAGASLQPPPRNLTIAAGWKNGTRLSDIFRTLTEGVPGTGMAAYDTVSVEDRFALAHYVRSLGAFAHAEDTPESIRALDEKYGLSVGKSEPSRVPVSRAIERMAVESRASPALRLHERMAQGPQADLFRRVVLDPQRVAQVLGASDAWRVDGDRFMALVTAGAPANGFSPSAATLTVNEWELLRRTLSEAFAGAEAANG